MKIVTATVELDLGYCTIPAREPTVLADGAALNLARAVAAEGLPLRVSGMGHYTRHLSQSPFGSGYHSAGAARLLVWRGCGLGDQLMASAVIRGLLAAHPELAGRIDLYGHPRVNRALWSGVEGLPFRALPEPIPLAVWLEYGAHLVLADMCEADQEPSQGHTVDRMLWAAGCEPDRIPPEAKLPYVPVTPADRAAAARIVRGEGDVSDGREAEQAPRTPQGGSARPAGPSTAPSPGAAVADASTRAGTPTAGAADGGEPAAAADNAPACGGHRSDVGVRGSELPRPPEAPSHRPLVLWQLEASTPIRSYRPDLARRALAGLVQAGCRVLASQAPFGSGDYSTADLEGAGVEVVTGVPIRTGFALCALADVVVAPDSVLAHAAGGLRRPCVGLWGSFSPRWRASYYPEHRALVGVADGVGGVRHCAPCGTHETSGRAGGCPLMGEKPERERYCAAIAGIDPEAVVAAVLEIAALRDQGIGRTGRGFTKGQVRTDEQQAVCSRG